MLALLERGHADRMFLSQDSCSTIDWFPREVEEQLKADAAPDWSMTFLFEQVIPELKERGMTGEQLDQMMVENPKRWLGPESPRGRGVMAAQEPSKLLVRVRSPSPASFPVRAAALERDGAALVPDNFAESPGACACCGDRLAAGAEVVYRHEPRETRCLRCGARLEDSKGYRPSLRWERKQRVAQ